MDEKKWKEEVEIEKKWEIPMRGKSELVLEVFDGEMH